MDAVLLKVLNQFNSEGSGEITKLKGDASSREYYRDPKNSLIICHYHEDQIGFDHFIGLQKILSENQIKTPRILHSEFPILIQEDLGDTSLNMDMSEKNYSKIINTLISWQKLPTNFEYKSIDQSFTKEKFMWELKFGTEHLDRLIPKDKTFDLKRDFESICDFILNDQQCPTHRDFHSKNIMIHTGDLYTIDFQDARLGPYLYDLVSLIEDPYVDLKKDYKSTLKEEFRSISEIVPKNDFEVLYKETAIQRVFKACGSFASQKNLKGKNDYLEYLRPALTNLYTLLSDYRYIELSSYVELNLKLWEHYDS